MKKKKEKTYFFDDLILLVFTLFKWGFTLMAILLVEAGIYYMMEYSFKALGTMEHPVLNAIIIFSTINIFFWSWVYLKHIRRIK